jgi:hypothetical protein
MKGLKNRHSVWGVGDTSGKEEGEGKRLRWQYMVDGTSNTYTI